MVPEVSGDGAAEEVMRNGAWKKKAV